MPTRTILFHISPAQQALFYLMALVSTAVCAWGFYRRWRLWRVGKPNEPITGWPGRIRDVVRNFLGHQRIFRRKFAGAMHALVVYGMAVLFIGTLVVAVEHYGGLAFGNGWFYKGAFYLLMKVTLDLFGLGLLIAVGMALGRRYLARPGSLGHTAGDGWFLALLFIATLTGFLLEGAGIAADPLRQPYSSFSPVGKTVAGAMGSVSPAAYVVYWWIHIPLVLSVIAALPYGRWLHLFVIPATVATQPARHMGELQPISLKDVEETGKIGLGTLADFSRWALMSLDGCMECGRCTDACPANAAGKPLNPKQIVLDLRNALTAKGAEASTDVIADESLWACTNCHACVRECPALIRHVDIIDGIRAFRVAEGRLSGSGATTLRQLGSRENPWGLPNSQRLDWAKGIEVLNAAEDDGRDVLLWVGCAGAFDPRAQKSVRATVQLMQAAGLKVAVLGTKERCTGDSARRMGDEFLFQQLAETNIANLNSVKAKHIVTTCPHCMHTLNNEYPALGGNYQVEHHTQFLAKLAAEGKLKANIKTSNTVAYHDPCFLARVNGQHEAPRDVIEAATGSAPIDPARNREKTFCCGAGGGRMWMEDNPDQRPGKLRAIELLATGAKRVAVGCPFCKVMVGDSVAQAGGENAPEVLDVAELLLEATGLADKLPSDNPAS